MRINEIVQKAHENAIKKGFWECSQNIPEKLALIHSEVTEALECHRKGYDLAGFEEELADVVIRTADLAGFLGLDLETAIEEKMEKNKDRPYLHGKAY